MSLRPYKFVVQAVVQEVDESGVVTDEPTSEPKVVFGVDGLKNYADKFADELALAEHRHVAG